MSVNLGRTLSFADGSQDSLLKSIKAASLKFKYSGKVDDGAINQILDALTQIYNENNTYQLELTSKNNDAIVDKIKDVISTMHTDAATSSTEILQHLEGLVANQDQMRNSIKETLKNEFKASKDTAKSTNDAKNTASTKPTDGVLPEKTRKELLEDSKKNEETNSFVKTMSAGMNKTKELLSKLSGTMWSKLSVLDTKIGNGVTMFSQGLSKSFQTFNATFKKLNPVKAIKGFSNKMSNYVSDAMKKFNPFPAIKRLTNNLIDRFNPAKLFKKKKPTKGEIKLDKVMDKINHFIDNFAEKIVTISKKVLDRILHQAKRFVSAIMLHVMMWLLANIVLVGLVFAFIVDLIAEPLAKLLEPIFAGLDSLLEKIIDFLTPIRDFLLKTLDTIIQDVIVPLGDFILKIFKSIFENVLEPFLRGIGSVAESIGRLFARLIDASTTFLVETFFPFMKEKFMPVFEVILDVLEDFFKAIKPWIDPIVNTVLRILKKFLEAVERWIDPLMNVVMEIIVEFFEAIKPWIKPLVDTVLSILAAYLDTIKILFETLRTVIQAFATFLANAFMEILNGVDHVYKALVRPMISAIGKFFAYIENIGEIIWIKLKSVLPGMMGGSSYEEQQQEKLEEIAEIKRRIERGEIRGDGWDNIKKLEELQNSLKNIEMAGGLEQTITDEPDMLAETAEQAAAIPEATLTDLANNVDVINDMYKLVQQIHSHLIGANTDINAVQLDSAEAPVIETSAPLETADDVLDNDKKNLLDQIFDKLHYSIDLNTGLIHFAEHCERTYFKPLLDASARRPNVVPIPIMGGTGQNAASYENH